MPNELHILSRSTQETSLLGMFIGRHLGPGSVIALTGDLGSGKTCLTQGIARGLGVPDAFYVTSPSYTLVNEYPGRIRLFHVDLYRMEGSEEIDDLGLDEMMEGNDVTVIEWAEKMVKILPEAYVSISISIVDDETRELFLSGRGRSALDLIEMCRREFGE